MNGPFLHEKFSSLEAVTLHQSIILANLILANFIWSTGNRTKQEEKRNNGVFRALRSDHWLHLASLKMSKSRRFSKTKLIGVK